VVVFALVVELDDIRVAQAGQQTSLPAEAVLGSRHKTVLSGDAPQNHNSVEAELPGLVGEAVWSLSEQLQDFVPGTPGPTPLLRRVIEVVDKKHFSRPESPQVFSQSCGTGITASRFFVEAFETNRLQLARHLRPRVAGRR